MNVLARPDQRESCRISVVICVYTEQRWEDMLAAIGSVARQSHRAHETIVVVDHNPGLRHRLEAELRQSDLPGVIVAANREAQGLSGGKNTGVAMASGDIVAFLDDDAVAEADWLTSFADTYAQAGVSGVGGMTLPRWDTGRPRWFPREFDWVIGCNYTGMAVSPQPARNLLGGNASFRRETFDLVGGFSTGVGRSRGGLPLGCEETEFCIRLQQASPDTTLLIDDRAVIWHRVPAARGRFSYFITRCYAEGLSKAQISRSVGAADGLRSERRHALATLPAGVGRNLAAPLRGDMSGLRRAGAILAGLAAAAAGFTIGRVLREAT